MKSSMRYESHMPEFFAKHEAAKEMVISTMSIDAERYLKTNAGMPVDKGQMKAATYQERRAGGGYNVVINKEYAAAQEEGQREGAQPFRNYTTPGTSAGFFQRAIDAVWANRANYIAVARKVFGL